MDILSELCFFSVIPKVFFNTLKCLIEVLGGGKMCVAVCVCVFRSNNMCLLLSFSLIDGCYFLWYFSLR